MAEEHRKGNKDRDPSRRAHLRDFHPDEKGDYRYEGRVREARFPESEDSDAAARFGQQVLRMWIAAAPLVPALIVIGTLPPEVMEDRVVLLVPYILEMILVLRILWAQYRVASGGGKLREYQYTTAAARQPLRCVLLIGAACISAAGGILRLVTGAALQQPAGMAVWFAMQCVLCVCALFLYKLHKQIRWS